jgi:hypothetical protein
MFLPTIDIDMNLSDAPENDLKFAQSFTTNYQDFEIAGYQFFTTWTNDWAKALIDTEIQSIIEKSGLGTEEQIVNNQASLQQASYIEVANRSVSWLCNETFKDELMYKDKNVFLYSDNAETKYPTAEKWALAMSLVNFEAQNYYKQDSDGGLILPDGYNTTIKNLATNRDISLSDLYPTISLAACGKNYYGYKSTRESKMSYYNTLDALTDDDTATEKKINIIANLVSFQYRLYQDWGYLSILSLPIVKLQTELIGELYDAGNDELMQEIDKSIQGDSVVVYEVMKAIPYLAVPTMSSVSDLIGGFGEQIQKAIGDNLGIGSALAKFAVGTVGVTVANVYLVPLIAKKVLAFMPILAIILIGLLRWLLIMLKMFIYHLGALFLLPIMLAKNNAESFAKFSLKVLSNMMEIPLFVLAVWTALIMHNILHTVGTYLSKHMVMGLLGNSNVSYGDDASIFSESFWSSQASTMSIYLFDGFLEVGLSLFSIYLIYKIMISFHTMILDVFEVQGNQKIDDMLESIRGETSSASGMKV